MGAYQYQALNKNGKSCKGVIEADSERHARQLLRSRDILPTHVSSLQQKNNKQHNIKNITKLDLSLITRQLATLLKAGIPIDEALQGVAAQSEKPNIQKLLVSIRAKVLEGFSLHQAMGEYSKIFPDLYLATIAAGEQTGKLDIILEKLADYTENQQTTKNRIQNALIYPSLMVIVSFLIISFIISYVVPSILTVFTDSGQPLPMMTMALLQVSNFVQNYGIYAIISVMAGVSLLLYKLKHLSFKRRFHRFILKIPTFGFLLKASNNARYIHTFAIVFASGVNVIETMKVASKVVTNLVMQESFNEAAIKVKEGLPIHVALKNTKFLSPMTLHLISSGEKSGQIAEMMERAANNMDNEVKSIVETMLTLLEPLIIILMGGVILCIVLATLLPIFSMEQLVN
jgi:general secretion pathway protein F